MSRKAKAKSVTEQHTYLVIEVTECDIDSEASLNMNLRDARPLFAHDDDPAYEYVTTLKIKGKSVSPTDRTGDDFELTIRGHELLARGKPLTLADYQARDENGMLQYRQYHGEQLPVYKSPPGLARLEKVRGENRWNAWLFVAPRLVSDMLHLIHERPLYVSLHEKKENRARWIQSIRLLTYDPNEDEG